MRIADIAMGKNSRIAKVEAASPAISAIPAIFRDGELANPDHPAACPFNTGGHTPAGCRWKPSLFYEAIATGALPHGCPFKLFCTTGGAK